MRAAALLAATAVFLLAAATPGAAFTSVPPGSSVHDDITAVARQAGWSASATEALQQAVREPDYQETELDPDGTDLDRIDATARYRPEHHCDREPGTPDGVAFNLTVAYIQAQRADAANASAAGDPDGAIAALGRALHALQDCYSHSNIVDLPDRQAAYQAILLGGNGSVAGLRLVSYAPGADDPEDPEGDDYTHKDYAKDDADKNAESRMELADGRTKFEHARDLARDATRAFLDGFMAERGEQERLALMDEEAEDAGAPDDVNVPALPAVGLVLVLAYAAVAWRRR